jgi:hypothetical protein
MMSRSGSSLEVDWGGEYSPATSKPLAVNDFLTSSILSATAPEPVEPRIKGFISPAAFATIDVMLITAAAVTASTFVLILIILFTPKFFQIYIYSPHATHKLLILK